MMIVMIKQTQERLGVTEGELYEAQPYAYDGSKITLLGRVPDGYDPQCNQYRSEVKILYRNVTK